MQDWDAKLLGGSIKRNIVNPDIEEERLKCNFDKTELAKFILTPSIYKEQEIIT